MFAWYFPSSIRDSLGSQSKVKPRVDEEIVCQNELVGNESKAEVIGHWPRCKEAPKALRDQWYPSGRWSFQGANFRLAVMEVSFFKQFRYLTPLPASHDQRQGRNTHARICEAVL